RAAAAPSFPDSVTNPDGSLPLRVSRSRKEHNVIKTELLYQPAYALAKVSMESGDEVRAEAGAMVSMGGPVEIVTQATGGLMKSLKRSMLVGESFFTNTFKATGNGAEVTLAPNLPGDIAVWTLNSGDLLVQSGSFL